MDAQSMERVLGALKVEYGSTCGKQERDGARELLQSVQASTELCYSCATTLLAQQSLPAYARVFALACLDRLATVKWNELQDDHKLAVRQAAIATARRTHSGEESFVRRKKAALLSDLALREFPQKWPGFVNELLDKQGSSEMERDALLELSFFALSQVAEDCADSDYNSRLPAKRRTDVLTALNLSAPTVIGELFAFAERCFGSSNNNKATTTSTKRVVRRRLCVAMRCLQKFATWVQWESEAMRLYDPVDFCTYLAAHAELSTDEDESGGEEVDVVAQSLRTLRALSASAHLDGKAAIKTAWALPRLCEVLYNKGAADLSDPDARERKARLWAYLAKCLTDIFRELTGRFKALGMLDVTSAATTNGGMLAANSLADEQRLDLIADDEEADETADESGKKASREVDEALAAYLRGALSVLTASTSLKAAEVLLPLWRDATRMAALRRCGPICLALTKETLLPHLVVAYAEATTKYESLESAADGALFEFLEEEEYEQHFASMRTGLASVLGVLVDLDPLNVARTTDARLRSLLQEQGNTARLDATGLVLERVCEETVRARDERRVALDRRKKQDTPSDKPQTPGKAEEALRILDDSTLQALLQWPVADDRARAHRKLCLFEALRSVVGARPTRLREVLRELFSLLAFHCDEAGSDAGVRRRAAWTLLRLAESAAPALASQFDELRNGASQVVGSQLLDELGQQHVCEALVLASNACDDESKRRELLEAVLRGPMAVLDAASGTTLASARGMLVGLGVLRGENTRVATAEEAESTDDDDLSMAGAESVRRALGAVLGVARRAASRGASTAEEEEEEDSTLCGSPKVPPSLNELTAKDASAAILVRVLPWCISALVATHSLWLPPTREALRQDPIARLALAPSIDEVRAKLDPGTAPKNTKANIEAAASTDRKAPEHHGPGRRKAPLRRSTGAKWSSILNELRSSGYQIARLWVERRCAFAPDALQLTGALLSACGLVESPEPYLEMMEHRHLASLLKHLYEPIALRCPPELYSTHLAPVIRRVALHMEHRLTLSWEHSSCEMGIFYASSGLWMPDWQDDEIATVTESTRRELTRAYLDVLQVAWAAKGELAAPVAVALKALDKKRASAHTFDAPLVPPQQQQQQWGPAISPGKKKSQKEIDDARNGLRIQAARQRRSEHVSLLRGCLAVTTQGGDLEAAWSTLRSLARALRLWGDIPTCRFATKLAVTILEECYRDARYAALLAAIFDAAVENLVMEPPWLSGAGCEFELLTLARSVYVALVIGTEPTTNTRRVPNETPMRHEGPRLTLLRLPGVETSHVQALEAALREPASSKEHRSALQDILVVALNTKEERQRTGDSSKPSNFSATTKKEVDTPSVDASALREQTSTVLDLPGELMSSRKLAAAQRASFTPPMAPSNLAELFR